MRFTGLFYTLLQVADAAVARNVLVALVQVVIPYNFTEGRCGSVGIIALECQKLARKAVRRDFLGSFVFHPQPVRCWNAQKGSDGSDICHQTDGISIFIIVPVGHIEGCTGGSGKDICPKSRTLGTPLGTVNVVYLMVEDEMSQLTCDDGGQFVFGIKSAEEARTDNHGAVGKHEGIWFGRLDDTYVQAFSTIAVNGGGIQFGEYSLHVRGYVVVLIGYLVQFIEIVQAFFVDFLAQFVLVTAVVEIFVKMILQVYLLPELPVRFRSDMAMIPISSEGMVSCMPFTSTA